jgi:hypothetical protein
MGLPNNMDISTVLKMPVMDFCGFIQNKLTFAINLLGMLEQRKSIKFIDINKSTVGPTGFKVHSNGF